MKWFNNPQTLEELKKQYKQFALKHHPDIGGNLKDMQEINSEYDKLFKELKNIHRSAEGKTYTAKEETTETANDFKNIIDSLINIDGINIEICGSWIWITGNTLPHKDKLKELKFKWSKSKNAWYFHNDGYKKRNNKNFTLDEIRDLYGSESVKANPKLELQII